MLSGIVSYTVIVSSSLNVRSLGILALALKTIDRVGAFPDKLKVKESYFSQRT